MSKKKEKEPEIESEEATKGVPAGEEGAEGEEGAPKKGKKKLIFIAGGGVLVVLIVVGLLLSGVLGGKKTEKKEEASAAATDTAGGPTKPVYYELPEFLVNLNSTTNKVSFLKMSVTLELKDQASVAIVDANKPRILDTFNTYLRELHPQDVQGSAGIYRLRDELMTRMNATIQDGLVKDILFSEIIVQ